MATVNQVIPSTYLATFLDAFLTAVLNGAGPIMLRLGQNDVTPGRATVLADFTEADFTGYAAIDVAGLWGAISTTSDVAKTLADEQTFTKSGATGNDIYTYYLTGPAGEYMIGARMPSAPVDMNTDGAELKVTAAWTQESVFPCPTPSCP